MEHLVCALFDDRPSAAEAIDRLVNGSVGSKVLNVVMHEGEITHEDLGLPGEQFGRRALQGAAIGIAIGGLLGAVLPVLSGVFVGGTLASALAGSAAGAVYGTVAGAISGRDDQKSVLEGLSHALESGKVLVTLDIGGSAAVREDAKEILARAGGQQITVS